MTVLAPADRDRLAKICGLFGSDHAGERAAAALKAATLLRERNVSWPDLLLPRIGRSAYAPPNAWRADIDFCQRQTLSLTDWERSFVVSIAGRARLSEKQQAILTAIAAKLRARDRA